MDKRPDFIQEMMDEDPQFRKLQERLEQQNKELEQMWAADKLVATDISEAIRIYENLVFNTENKKSIVNKFIKSNSVIFRPAVNPIKLVAIYYKAEMYDKCWQLLNLMLNTPVSNPSERCPIREYQSKICEKEGKPIDALQFMMLSIASNYYNRNNPVEKDKIEKKIIGKIKKAKFLDQKDEIINTIITNLKTENYELNIINFVRKLGSDAK